MYKSPIEIICADAQARLDGEIMRAVQRYDINVDNGELLRALQYDRGQYEKGFEDGKAAMLEEIAQKICDSYDECTEGECPGYKYCDFRKRNGALEWLKKVVEG